MDDQLFSDSKVRWILCLSDHKHVHGKWRYRVTTSKWRRVIMSFLFTGELNANIVCRINEPQNVMWLLEKPHH